MSDTPTGPTLFTPLRLRSLTLRNRIVVSPMCQYASSHGAPADWHLVNFGKYAVGGAAVVFGEETAIEARGRKTHDCAGLWNRRQAQAYLRINTFIRAQGALPAVQLGHSGGKGACHGARLDWIPLTPDNSTPGHGPWRCLAPSATPQQAWPQLTELDAGGIRRHLQRWREASARSLDAGYQILEIHGAHGYLIHQFLSPLTNRRTDNYGGSRENRMRFALEIAETVRQSWPAELPLFFRVSAVDGKGGVWNLDDSVVLAAALRERGVDVIDCSSGGISGGTDMPIVRRVPGYQVGFAERIRRETGATTMAVGLITEPEQAEAIVASGQADLVALARELIWNPNWPAHAAARLLGADSAHLLLPPEQSHRLRRRDSVAALPVNRGGASSAADDALTETT